MQKNAMVLGTDDPRLEKEDRGKDNFKLVDGRKDRKPWVKMARSAEGKLDKDEK